MLAWIRSPPTKPAGPKVRALFEQIANDSWFHTVARLSPEEAGDLQRELASAEICCSNVLQGGFAGKVPGRGLVLGLSLLHQRRIPAVHELLHVVRHLRGVKDLDDETEVWREECIVWAQTLQYAPIRATLELLVPLGIIGLLVSGTYFLTLLFLDWLGL